MKNPTVVHGAHLPARDLLCNVAGDFWHRPKLIKSQRRALLALAIFILSCQLGFAQTPSPSGSVAPSSPLVAPQALRDGEPVSETERVIVTGSNIPAAQEVGPNPVITIDRDYIEKSGERTTEELLGNLSVAGPKTLPTFNGVNSFTQGASAIALRGFDPSDTLVLIDGRRLAAYPLGTGGGGTQSFVDLNSIPRAAIQSIEILKDSASTTYGADAVAGVVNIKLRRDYRGAEASVEYGNTLDKDAGEFAASLVFGLGDGNTNVSGVMDYYHRNSIFDQDRAYSGQFLSTNSSPFNLQLSAEAVIAAGGTPPMRDGVPVSTFFGHAPYLSDGNAPASEYEYSTGRRSIFNTAFGRSSLPTSESYGGFANFDHKVFGDEMILYGDMFYQHASTLGSLAPTPTGNFDQPGQTILAIPPHAPGPTLGGPTYEETGVPEGAYNPFNPFQQIISGGSRARLAEFADRTFTNETDAYFSTLGVRGDKLFNGSWGYDASFRFSEIKNVGIQNVVSASRFNRILNAADPIFDPASPQFIGTTVPYNPFGDYRVPIPANSAAAEFAVIRPKEFDSSTLATFDLNMYTTELFKLPAGGVALAFGGQFRRESLRQMPDQQAIAGDILGESAATFTNAGRKTYAIYAEADLPVFGSSFSAPGFHALEFTAAARYEEFLSSNTNVLVPKFGMRWQPFDDSFTIRSTWGEGFHVPSLAELYGSGSSGIAPFQFDPAVRQAVGDVPFTIRSNPTLQPEDSRAFTAGIVYTPTFVRGLTLTLDFFNIESAGRVNSSPNLVYVLLRALEGRGLYGERVVRDAEGNLVSIETAYENGGSQKARGVDFGIQYQLETKYGLFTSVTQGTYTDSFQFADTPGVPEKELVGDGDNFFGGQANLRWRGTSRLDWDWNHVTVGTTLNYRDGFHEHHFIPGGALIHYVKQTWFFDARAAYEFTSAAPAETNAVAGYSKAPGESGGGRDGKAMQSATEQTVNCAQPLWQRALNGTTIAVGCNDVFGQDPPHTFNTGIGYPLSLYDPTGRFVYVSVTKKF